MTLEYLLTKSVYENNVKTNYSFLFRRAGVKIPARKSAVLSAFLVALLSLSRQTSESYHKLGCDHYFHIIFSRIHYLSMNLLFYAIKSELLTTSLYEQVNK
jgi:hypothetical protein